MSALPENLTELTVEECCQLYEEITGRTIKPVTWRVYEVRGQVPRRLPSSRRYKPMWDRAEVTHHINTMPGRGVARPDRTDRRRRKALPPELHRWLSADGENLLVVLSTLLPDNPQPAQLNALLLPVPVDLVQQAGYHLLHGYVILHDEE